MSRHAAALYEVETPEGYYLDEVGEARLFYAACVCGWRSEWFPDHADARLAGEQHAAAANEAFAAALWARDARP